MRKYALTLPSGVNVEITIAGPTLIAAANALLKGNDAQGWGYEDCLTMQSLSAINGVPVSDVGEALNLDTKDYLALRALVANLVAPSTAQLETTYASLVLLDNDHPTDVSAITAA